MESPGHEERDANKKSSQKHLRRKDPQESGQKSVRIVLVRALEPALKDSPIYILRALVFFFLAQAVLAEQPAPILPDPKLTSGDTFDVTAQDVCVPGYASRNIGNLGHGLKEGEFMSASQALDRGYSPAGGTSK